MSRSGQTAATAFLAAAGGDHAAYLEFYDVMAPTVYGLCHRITRDRAQAESAAVDTFIDLWRMAPSFDPVRHDLRSWSSATAYRRAVDRVHAAAADPATDAAEPPEVLVLTARPDTVCTIARELPPGRRTTLDLLAYRGWGLGTVARRLGVTVADAAMVVTSAMRQIRDSLREGSTEGVAAPSAAVEVAAGPIAPDVGDTPST